ncbi:efflux RND transporter periplasmic adaptor subunit [Paenibacillus harenae]|uniref:efflux RND transporter periplasmic adaptor subunit n=1 Tax=Paenibacillus harenae TaxID=306543 RepID=UPI0003FB116B|nr:efflux RND transporter periplasmic adaptor subunit [Paenibacillus harenae]
MKKWAIWLGVILILAASGAGAYYYYFGKDTEGAGEAAQALTVTATKGSIIKQISGTGSVAAKSRETVTAGKSGTIAAVHVKEGDMVKAGQVLVTFEDTDDYDDQIESIQKNVTKLEADMEGYQESYKEATGTENEEATKKDLEKKIEDAKSDIIDYEDDLQEIYEEQSKEEKAVIASIDGEVIEMDIEAGDEVQSNTTIATIVDYTRLEFVTSVDELDIPSVKVGQAVDITLSAITDRTIKAAVSEIAREGSASNGSSAFEVSLLLKDIEGVKVGMSGEAAITIESKENIVLVPVNAVVAVGNRSFVRVPAEEGGEAGAAGKAGDGTQAGGRRGQAGEAADADGQAPSADRQAPAGGTAPSASGKAPVGGTAPSAGGQAPAGGEAPTTGGNAPADGTGPVSGGQAPAGGGGGGIADRLASRIDTLGGTLAEVTTGLSNENFVEIVSGLAEGDSVLVPIAQGTPGMGSGTEEQMQNMRSEFIGTFPDGGMGGFPAGGSGAVRVMPGGGER